MDCRERRYIEIKVCPYCVTSVQGEVEFENYDSLEKAIYGVILKNWGKAFLKPPLAVGLDVGYNAKPKEGDMYF